MALTATFRDFVDAMLHPSVRCDAMTSARHRAFIAPRLIGSFAVLAAFPIYLVWRGAPSALEVMVFGWLVAPILLAYYLSRTGRYESAHMLSSLALTSLVLAVAVNTGGIDSFAAVWLVVVPLEASLSTSRRVVGFAALIALGATLALMGLSLAGMLPQPDAGTVDRSTFMALGILSAALYAAGLALGAENLARTSFWLLYAEEDRYRLLARNMSDVICRHGRNGAVDFVSPAAEALFGVPLRELTGHGLFDRVHVADRPAFLTAIADAATGNESRSVEFRVKRSAGRADAHQFIWIEMRCRPLDQAGAPRAGERREVVSVMRDVTERKSQEEALLDARGEAERANAAKGRFLATMSHELRTPLNAIIGFSEMLLREDELALEKIKRQDYARLINDSGHHLLSVVNDILDMSKIETGNFEIAPEPFAPRECIVNCCDLIALKARERQLDLVMRLPDTLPQMNGDRRALKQILLNLLSNAVKFTEPGGVVTVSAVAEEGKLKLAIEDGGVGIAPEDLKRLGEPFFQAGRAYDRRHEGTGLGLSIVKGLIDLHGGEFSISSEPGKGTVATVSLPLDYVAPRPAEPVPKVTVLAPTRNQIPPQTVRKSA